MGAPEYLICINCETPCYVFTWKEERLAEVLCEVCGNDDTDSFLSQDDFDGLVDS